MSDQSTSTSVAFKEIPKFTGYRIGDDGSVWSRWALKGGRGNRRRILSDVWKKLKTPPKSGYPRLTLIDDNGLKVEHHVHVLMLIVFVGPRPSPSMQAGAAFLGSRFTRSKRGEFGGTSNE